MNNASRRILLCLALATVGTGCAHSGTGVSGSDEAEKNHRTRNTLIAVGAAIALGAIVAKQAENSSKDIVRDVVRN